ncbi:MAG: hypothetical protein KME54_11840 [Tolypothrix brevis GSE-NOS-MK-07-07A]|nr:hypothetical protein [Tolypothrix brevis GSE-NOS-MK-07-07A]
MVAKRLGSLTSTKARVFRTITSRISDRSFSGFLGTRPFLESTYSFLKAASVCRR